VKLYVVRHAIAEDSDPSRWPDDSLRPLTDRGVRQFRKAARGLRALVTDVDVVLSSPAVRAWDTAQILADEAGWPNPMRCEELWDGSAADVAGALQPFAGARSLALVGHEPTLSRLMSLLLTGGGAADFIEMKKGAVAHLEPTMPGQIGRAELIWSLPPRVLRALS
jgi:phosphohistidine phosphatase